MTSGTSSYGDHGILKKVFRPITHVKLGSRIGLTPFTLTFSKCQGHSLPVCPDHCLVGATCSYQGSRYLSLALKGAVDMYDYRP